MKYSIECKYCGKKWNEYFYKKSFLVKCPDCKSQDAIGREYDDSTGDIFGYNYEVKIVKKDTYGS